MAQDNVAIIGAGISGLVLSFLLHQQAIPCTVYDVRPSPLDIGNAITLSPNALRILDNLDVYQQVMRQGYQCEYLDFRSQDDEPFDIYEIGSVEKYGYPGLRIYRKVLITELLAKCSEKGISIVFGKKFVKILSESDNDVSWEWADGTASQAASLVGADGIHSRVRSYIHPGIEPKFLNVLAIAGAVPTSSVGFPNDYHLPVTIMSKTHGAYILAPNLPDGSELMVVKQRKIEEHDRKGWKALLEDKKGCVDFLQQGADDFPEVVRNAVSGLDPESIFIWPFYEVPEMDSWTSKKGRVTILGDAAHAISPSSGQGANQVFEDAYTYALIRGQSREDSLKSVLSKWQKGRQERIDRLIVLARQMNVRRLPESEAREFENEVGLEDFNTEWLFKPDLKQTVQDWLHI